MSRIPLLAVFVLAICHPVSGQDAHQDPHGAMNRLSSEVTRLKGTAGSSKDDRLLELWRQMEKDTQGLVTDLREKHAPKEYVESLNVNSELLKDVNEKDIPDSRKVEICEAVAEDLRIKRQRIAADPKTGARSIDVSVRTKDGVDDVHGCEVWYVHRGQYGNEKAYKRYEKLSSPSSRGLPPGNYLMWSKRNASDGERKPVTVGDDPGMRKEVDLPVPSKT